MYVTQRASEEKEEKNE